MKEIESTGHGSPKDITDASLVCIPSVGQSRSEKLPVRKIRVPVMVPVIGIDGLPLMPTHPARARRLIKDGKGKKKWFKWCN